MDGLLRQSERESMSGDLHKRLSYAANLERAGRPQDALRIYGAILSERNADYSLAQQGILDVGLPWVELDPLDGPNTVRFYNVMHWDGDKRVPYVFTWDTALYNHPERNYERPEGHWFDLKTLAGILAKQGVSKRPPTASAVHSHVLTLEDIIKLRLQPQEAQRARRFIREHLEARLLMWSQIDCDNPGVIQDYDKQEQRDNTDIRGSDDYLRNLNARGVKEGAALIKEAVLRAEQSVAEIDRMYNDLLDLQYGVYYGRPGLQARRKRAVMFSCYDEEFYINCDIHVGNVRPARLVVAQRAKNFPVKTKV